MHGNGARGAGRGSVGSKNGGGAMGRRHVVAWSSVELDLATFLAGQCRRQDGTGLAVVSAR